MTGFANVADNIGEDVHAFLPCRPCATLPQAKWNATYATHAIVLAPLPASSAARSRGGIPA